MHHSFFKRLLLRSRLSFRIIFKKQSVDPIQDAIITENVLAVMGVGTPVLTSFLCYATGLGWIDLIGEFSNGVIQIYLGYLICKENSQILIGRSLQSVDNIKLLSILNSRREIKDIQYLKTTYSNDELALSAEVVYDQDFLAQKLIRALENDIKQISLDEASERGLKELLTKSTYLFITHNAEVIRKIENDIIKAFPCATEIDIEKCVTNIKKELQGVMRSELKKFTPEDMEILKRPVNISKNII